MGAIDELNLTDVTKARLGQPTGSAGVIEVGGYVVTDEVQADLTGQRKYKTFEQFLNEISIIAAGVRLFLNLISKSQWQVIPADVDEGQKAEAKRIAEAVESMMFDHNTPWHRIIRKLTMYRFYGFAVMEWTAKKRPDGQIGMMDVRPRPQRTIVRWDLDKEAVVKGLWQQDANYQEVYIPRDRLIYAVDDTLTENPEGAGLLRHVARAVNRLKAYEGIESTGFENDLRGMPVAYAPLKELAAQGDEKKNKAKRPLLDFIKGHIRNRKSGMLLDSETYRSTDDGQTPSSVRKWAVELMRGESTAFDAMANAIARLNQEIARILGVEHLLVGADGVGSLALAKSKVGTFYITVISTQSELVEIVERDWLGPLADMNGWPDELLPSVQVEEVRDEDIGQITEALNNMANAGAVLSPDDEAIKEVFAMLGLTPPEPELRQGQMDLMGGIAQPGQPGIDPTKLPPGPQGQQQNPKDVAPQPDKTRKWIGSMIKRGRR